MIQKTFDELKLTGQLPSPPGVGMKILKLTQGEDFSAEEIGRTIMADPALTGRLLRIANSAQAGAARPITTVADATMRLGVRAVRNVALGLSLVSAYRAGSCPAFNYDRYWSISLARAVAAQSISRQMRVGTPAEAYILGLLSEIGCLALASVYPAEYGELLLVHGNGNGNGPAMSRAERERFEIDHGEVGAYMLEEWGLPESYSQALQMYEQAAASAEDKSSDAGGFARILRHAQLMAEICMTTESAESAAWTRYAAGIDSARLDLGLEAEPFFLLCSSIVNEWQEWGNALKVPTQKGVDFSLIPERARRVPAVLSSPNGMKAEHATPASTAPAAKHPSDWNPVAQSVPTAAARSATAADAAPAAELLAPSNEEKPGTCSSLRILAVDDDAVSLKLLERHLVKAGHQVKVASDGNQALQIALESNPQVVIADWMMPNLDGIGLCKALRRIEAGRDIFYLLLTGRAEEDRVVEAFDAGVDDYVVKPLNAKLLLARIKGGQRVIELKQKVESDRQTMMKQVAELGLLTRKLRTAALTDVLTSLPNRRYAMKRLEQEWEASQRTNRALSVIMIDIDHFKKVNDVHGHDIGDVVLKETADVLRSTTRQGEDPARLGGEEFLVICSNTTEEQAAAGAERIRAAVAAHHINSGSFDGIVTISLGVAGRTASMPGIDALIKSADEAVYMAKGSGRNQVKIANVDSKHSKSA